MIFSANKHTVSILKKRAFLVVVLVSYSFSVFPFLYGEHKKIGDLAFTRFIETLQDDPKDTFFLTSLGIDASHSSFSFLSPEGGNLVSYGVLNGLSGDHESNPLALQEQLNHKESVIQKIISLHEQYIREGYTAAPDGKLAGLDFRYALLAAVNMSHFYVYGKDLEAQLKPFDPQWIKQCQDPAQVRAVFKKLGKTNALTMYLTMHLLAMDLAAQAGQLQERQPDLALALIRNAILFNGFADHFLEDAFSSGHLVVNRSPLASFTNNKALHDFYSENGSIVINRQGEIWKAYGDGQLQKSQPERIVAAVKLSIREVFEAFKNGVTMHTGPAELVRTIKPLALIPIPYNTDLKEYLPDSAITATAASASQILPQRNFVRSRIGNSFVFGFNSRTFSDHYFEGGEFRIKFGLFSKKYDYNERGTKCGMLDSWHGYTLSYSFGRRGIYQSGQPEQDMYLLKGGIRSNFDYWITDKKFLGITSYMETGLQFKEGKTAIALVPSAGVQLGPLLNINYYNMPVWLRIPAQFFLPLELRFGSVITRKNAPSFFSGFDLNYVF